MTRLTKRLNEGDLTGRTRHRHHVIRYPWWQKWASDRPLEDRTVFVLQVEVKAWQNNEWRDATAEDLTTLGNGVNDGLADRFEELA